MKNKTLGRDALEKIMRDVLEGLQDFTRLTSLASRNDSVGNDRQKKAPPARAQIIHFPRRYPTN